MRATTTTKTGRFLTAGISLFLAFFLIAIGSTPAYANPIGGGVGGDGGGGSSGGGGVGNGGGGNSGGGAPTYGWKISYTNYEWKPGIGCAATKNNGAFRGTRLSLRFPAGTMTKDEALSRFNAHRQTGASLGDITYSTECIYREQYVVKTVTCVTKLDASLAMTAPRKKSLGNVPYTSPFVKSQRLKDCENGNREVAIKKEIEDFGRYQFTGTATIQDCSYKHYTVADGHTGKMKGDEIEKCSKPRPKPPVVKKWQLDCDGFHEKWFGSPTWNADHCKSTSGKPGSWTCTAPGANKINGEKTSKATLFRDGEDNPLVFGKSKPKGKSIVSINKTDTRIHRDAKGTPWIKGKRSSANAFGLRKGTHNVLNTDTKTSWKGGNNPKLSAFGLMESTQGKPTSLKAEYRFGMTVKAEKVRIKSVNIKTGIPVIERIVINKKTTGTCFSKPLNLNFVRAVVSQ